MGIDVALTAPWGASPSDLTRLGEADFNVVLYPEIAETAARGLERAFGQKWTKTVPIGVGATRAFIAEVAALAGIDAAALEDEEARMPWYSRSIDSNYLTGKRVFVFGDATHAMAAARVAKEEFGFEVVGLGTYSHARPMRALAEELGLEALITDDYLDVEARVQEFSRSWCSAPRWSGTSPSGSACRARSSPSPSTSRTIPPASRPRWASRANVLGIPGCTR